MNDKLRKMLIDNPKLQMFALVNSDVLGSDDYAYWYGEFGDCEIREYAIVEPFDYDDKTVVFRDDPEEYVIDLIDNQNFSNDDIEVILNKLDWEKAIWVSIKTPDSLH